MTILSRRFDAVLLSFFALCGASSSVFAADWPHVRGPNYDGRSSETGLIDAWPATGPPVLWTRELGQGFSGFVVAEGRAITQIQLRTGQFVIALAVDTGTEIWRQRVDWPWQPASEYPGPYATPTLHGDRVYYATPAGTVGCLDSADGRSIWSVNVREKFQGRGTEFGYAATPLVEDGRVILPVGGPDASLVALDANSGATFWAAGEDQASYCPAFPITLGGRRLIAGYLRNCLVAHDPATGERLWREELSANYDEHSAWPLYSEPHLLVAAPFKIGSQALRLNKAGPPRRIWANKNLSNDVCSSVLFDGHVFGFDLQQLQASAHRTSRGIFKCLDFATGSVCWETDRIGHATVLLADGKLILLNDTGTLILAKANSNAYEELVRAKVLDGGIGWTPPALSDSKLFLRNQAKAVCVYLGPAGTIAANDARTLPIGEPIDWSRLLTREPEFPHDAPTLPDIARWFAWCVVGVFGGAAAIATLVWLTAKGVGAARPGTATRVAFIIAAAALGLVGTSLFSAWADAFVLTWPATLYLVFRLTLAVVIWAEAKPDHGRGRPRLAARAMVLILVAACFGYYQLCLAVGYVMAWGFLAGFLPAAPFAIIASRSRRIWLKAIADAVAFSVYFWTSALLPAWKDSWLG